MTSAMWRLLLLLPLAAVLTAQGVITTIAGRPWVFLGDGKPALNAQIGPIPGVAVDAAGNVYASDEGNRMVFKVSPSGVLTVVAGNGQCCSSGDGGPAVNASLYLPFGLTFDTAGNLYIADQGANRVRKVTPGGTITTVAGNGGNGFSGDGGAATAAQLAGPTGVAVDSGGNLFISVAARIRRVATDGTISTFAGTGIAGFGGDGGPPASALLNSPAGLAFDSSGALYIADTNNNRIRKIPRGGAIITIAGTGVAAPSGDGGPAINASVNNPFGVATDTLGNLYIADSNNDRLRRVDANGIITTVAGTSFGYGGDGGPGSAANFASVWGVAAGGGNLYIADHFNKRVRQVSPAGIVTTIAGGGLFKSSPDGTAARSAYLEPNRITLDRTGNLYYTDRTDARVRKIGLDGTISTVIGNGVQGVAGNVALAPIFSPEGVAVDPSGTLYFANAWGLVYKLAGAAPLIYVAGGGSSLANGVPATSAYLNGANGISFDAQGNLYICEDGGHRVRKVDTQGVITTVAGNGGAGFSGDGGPATSAALNYPRAAVVDSLGNLYIADWGNHRIRKVSPAGMITTVAGTGSSAFSGDGGPAINAALSYPNDVLIDAAGNLLIADRSNGRVRKVDTNGIISTIAGGGFTKGDGGSSVSAGIDAAGLALDSSGNLYIANENDGLIRKVLASPPTFSVTPAALNFTAPAGTPQAGSQQIATASNVTGITWAAQSSTTDGNPWLSFTPAYGYTPGSLTVNVSTAGLKPGSYQGTITLQAPLSATPNQTVRVNLTVTVPIPAVLVVAPAALQFKILTGSGNPPPQTLTVSNGGDGVLNWTAQATVAAGVGNWLTLSAASGTATGTLPAAVQANVNVSGLAAGVYSGSITVSSSTSNQTITIPATLVLSVPTPTILLSQTGLTYTAVVGGGAAPAQSIGILNVGQGTMNWTATVTTLGNSGNWLTVSPGSGSSAANTLQIPLATISVNAASLAAGQYTGQVAVTVPGATNNPQYVVVILNVLPRGSTLPVVVRPTGLIFASQAANAGSLAAQNVTLATGAPADVGFASGLLTYDGGTWLTSGTSNSVVPSGGSTTVSVLPKLASLGAGVYRGGMTVLFSDGSPSQVVDILSVVVPASSAQGREGGAAAACAPQRLQMVQQTLSSNFGSPVGYPAALQVQVVDDCGNAVSNATVLVSFSNGDASISLASLGNGSYAGTWQPTLQSAQVTVSFRASLPPLTPATAQAQGSVAANAQAPLLFTGGVVSAASYAPGGVHSPGEIVAAFGQNLAGGVSQAPSIPLPSTLGGATLQVGGTSIPLYFANSGQVTAQLPYELTPGTQPQIVARGAGFIAPPQTITIVQATPSIFSMTQDGKGQGAIFTGSGVLVNSAAPATAGDTVVVYCTGLGATSPSVASGQAAPGGPNLARATTTVNVGIGGKPGFVSFAGLVPGLVGLYQVNVQIPSGVSNGSAIPLVLSQNGVASNSVTLAIR